MRKIERRAMLCLLLAAALTLGLAVFCFRFFLSGGRWVSFAANRHLYNSQGELAVGRVLDRDGDVLSWVEDGRRTYYANPTVREATLHAVGDAQGKIGTGALVAFADKLSGYNWITGAYRLGGGGFIAPAQRVGDFLAGRPSEGPGKVKPTYRPGVRFTDLRQCLPEFVARAIAQALPEIDAGPIPGYGQSDAVLTAVESRSSAPVRILRDRERYCSAIEGLYPCGEGAGYAGGIMSAASDGIHVAEQILEELR